MSMYTVVPEVHVNRTVHDAYGNKNGIQLDNTDNKDTG